MKKLELMMVLQRIITGGLLRASVAMLAARAFQCRHTRADCRRNRRRCSDKAVDAAVVAAAKATMTTLPREIVRFILTSVPSVPYLEAMLVMRNEPDIVWTCHDLAQRLYLTDKKAKTLLDALVDAEIAVRIDADPHQYRYQPDTLLQDRLDELADIYARNLIEVTQLIHAKADRRAEQFADAFKWHQTRKI